MSHSLRLTPFESTMAGLLWSTAAAVGLKVALAPVGSHLFVGRLFLLVWLLYYALAFTAAPLYAYKSLRTATAEPELAFEELPPMEVAA